jgi:hypothetical protein
MGGGSPYISNKLTQSRLGMVEWWGQKPGVKLNGQDQVPPLLMGSTRQFWRGEQQNLQILVQNQERYWTFAEDGNIAAWPRDSDRRE